MLGLIADAEGLDARVADGLRATLAEDLHRHRQAMTLVLEGRDDRTRGPSRRGCAFSQPARTSPT